MGYSGAGGKLIDEKYQKRKISWHCPFKTAISGSLCLTREKLTEKFLHSVNSYFNSSAKHWDLDFISCDCCVKTSRTPPSWDAFYQEGETHNCSTLGKVLLLYCIYIILHRKCSLPPPPPLSPLVLSVHCRGAAFLCLLCERGGGGNWSACIYLEQLRTLCFLWGEGNNIHGQI